MKWVTCLCSYLVLLLASGCTSDRRSISAIESQIHDHSSASAVCLGVIEEYATANPGTTINPSGKPEAYTIETRGRKPVELDNTALLEAIKCGSVFSVRISENASVSLTIDLPISRLDKDHFDFVFLESTRRKPGVVDCNRIQKLERPVECYVNHPTAGGWHYRLALLSF